MNKSKINMLLSALAAATLVACGGGGGGGDSTSGGNPITNQPQPPAPNPDPVQPPAPEPDPTQPPAPDPMQTDVPAPAYEAESEALKVFRALNEERDRCGFGKLAQNTLLDKAAEGHGKYLELNGITSHYQWKDDPGFTGVDVGERTKASGYWEGMLTGVMGEVVAFPVGGASNIPGVAGLRSLFNAPYHASGLLDGYRDVGIHVGTRLVINSGLKNAQNQLQALHDDTVLTFPCQGTVHIAPSLDQETPQPFPDRNLRKNPLGVSIQVMVKMGNQLRITSATMTNLVTGANIPMLAAVGKDNDPHGRYEDHQGFVAADVAMKPETPYQATVNGTNNGKPFSRTFKFDTGKCLYENLTKCVPNNLIEM